MMTGKIDLRSSLKARFTRQIVVAFTMLLTVFSGLTVAVIAGHLYRDAERDTKTILEDLARQQPNTVRGLIDGYNRFTDPRIWPMVIGRVWLRSPNAAATPTRPTDDGMLWNPATYRLSTGIGTSTYVIDWPLASDVALLTELSTVLVLVMLALLAAAVGMARWATSRILEPVKVMTSGVQRMLDQAQILPLPRTSARDEFYDLTELLNRVLSDLDEGRKRDHALLAAATHHLRTPLAVIRGNLEVASREDDFSSPTHAESMAAIYRTLEDMSRLIEDLLSMEHVADLPPKLLTTLVLKPTRATFMEDVSAMTVGRTDIAIEVGDAAIDETRTVLAYPEFARRAFWAVMENAFKYCEPGAGRIWVKLEGDGHRGLSGISIANNGPGIAPDEIPEVFTRFYQGRLGRPLGGGTGLGLSLAQSLMRAQSGMIELASSPALTRVTLWFRNA